MVEGKASVVLSLMLLACWEVTVVLLAFRPAEVATAAQYLYKVSRMDPNGAHSM